ncbi:hypothetical protein GWI33_022558 [Rhynchophorus ferrugineus]|uniref:Uncharacterized protein n=1 Tax=Rhynchophorus ferrugineus TaxID=354439 RepID=A0A834MHS2_RHYFE|nr:hypothetical protein GWI33_022558 [Rhynchophorus ferrugineus]
MLSLQSIAGQLTRMRAKIKYSARYLRLARLTGCVKFKKNKGVKTLDVPVRDREVFRYFLETSNWFLFEKDDHQMTIMDLYLR